jgi:uncharacterized membrane protein
VPARTVTIAVTIFLVSLLIRVCVFSADALGLDEAASVLIAKRELPDIFYALARDGNPPGYYLLLHYWMNVVGDSEIAVRSLSLLVGSALPAAIYLFARRAFDSTTASFAAILSSVAPLHLYYSSQVRMYSLLPLLSLACFASLTAAIATNTTMRWVGVGIAAAVCMWTHNYGLFVITALPVAWWVLEPAKARSIRSLCWALALGGILYLPWLPAVRLQLGSPVADFIRPLFERQHVATTIPLAFLNLTAGSQYPDYLYSLSNTWSAPWFGITWLILVSLLSLSALVRDPRRVHGATLVLTLAPLLFALATSLFVKPIFLLGRYEIVVFPFLVLFIARGLAWSSNAVTVRAARSFGLILFALFITLAVIQIESYRKQAPNRIAERIAHAIGDVAQPGDRVIVTGLVRAPVEYYLGRIGAAVSLHSFPTSGSQHLGWYEPSEYKNRSAELSSEAARLVDDQARSSSLFLVAHAASPAVDAINELLYQQLALKSVSAPLALYAAGPDPNSRPVFLLVKYAF